METKEISEILSTFSESERIFEDLPKSNQIDTKIKIKLHFTPELEQSFAILRHLFKIDELSERGMQLTKFIISTVKNHYAAWTYRKIYLLKLNSSICFETDKSLSIELISIEPKGFQSWDHLKFCIDKLKDVNYEEMVSFLFQIYLLDTKNYHAWAFRVWWTERFGFYKNELVYISELLEKDLSNNSIWSYRHFLATNLSLEKRHEINFVKSIILNNNFKNESAWFYFDDIYESLGDFCEELEIFLIELIKNKQKNRFVLKSLVFNELRKKKEDQKQDMVKNWLWELENTYDKERCVFWKGFLDIFR